MAVIRICHETGCRTLLSLYNPTPHCWEHRRVSRRIQDELDGTRVQRDDEWVKQMKQIGDAEIETWRPHMMSETFVAGLERRALTPTEKKSYENGEWLG